MCNLYIHVRTDGRGGQCRRRRCAALSRPRPFACWPADGKNVGESVEDSHAGRARQTWRWQIGNPTPEVARVGIVALTGTEKPLPRAGETDNAFAWDAETAVLVDWFLKTPPPVEPFELYQGVTVLRPDKFWGSLNGDIAAGPGKARAYTETFQKDLRRLAELFGGPAKIRQLKG